MANRKVRIIFFWSLVALFVVTAPIIIFYAQGYRFSFQQGIFIYTGSITIKSNPQKIDIFINGKPASKKKTNLINNSYHIDGIKPGEYLLEISAPGYNNWTKKIAIHSGVSTEFWNVLLVKNEYSRTKYPVAGIRDFFISPDQKFIVYTQKESNEFLVKIMDIGSGITKNIFSSLEYQPVEEKIPAYRENIEWSPQTKKLIIPTEKDGRKFYFIVDIESLETANLKDIVKAEEIKNVRWDVDRKNNFFYMSGTKLYRANITGSEIVLLAENVASYDISPSGIFYFHIPDGIVYKADSGDGATIAQITNSSPEKSEDFDYRIIAYDEERLVLFGKNGGFFVYNNGELDTYFKKLSSEINGVQFSDDGKKLIYWDDYEIASYFLRDWDVQPQRQENESKSITRFSQKITAVQWSNDYEHVIFAVGNEIKIIELDHRDHKNLANLTTLVAENSRVSADFSQNKIYFTDTERKETSLYSIDFPEKNGILGIR